MYSSSVVLMERCGHHNADDHDHDDDDEMIIIQKTTKMKMKRKLSNKFIKWSNKTNNTINTTDATTLLSKSYFQSSLTTITRFDYITTRIISIIICIIIACLSSLPLIVSGKYKNPFLVSMIEMNRGENRHMKKKHLPFDLMLYCPKRM